MRITGLVAALVFTSSVALAQDVSQTVGHGQINWTQKTVTATGSGAPSLKAANAAVARLGAERAAKMDAYRNVLEAIRGARISGDQSAGAAMDKSPELKSKVEGVVQGFKVMDTKYYSDGGVDVIIQGPMDGVLAALLLPDAGKKAATGGSDAASGLVINAKGQGVTPALAPRLVDEAGNEIYGASVISADALKKQGAAAYAKSVDAASKDPRVGPKALVVKALRPVAAGSSDLVVAAADADKIKKLGSALADAKVIIVTD